MTESEGASKNIGLNARRSHDPSLASSDLRSNGRQCGPCKACCEGWMSDNSLQMRPGKPCQNLCDRGCGIYESRPERPCKEFVCAWLTNANDYPEDLRPDLSGVIIIENRPWREWYVLRLIACGTDIPERSWNLLTEIARRKNIPIVAAEYPIEEGVFSETVRTRAFGPPEFLAARKKNEGFGGVVEDDVLSF